VALPLHNPQVSGVHIDIREAELHQFGIPQPVTRSSLSMMTWVSCCAVHNRVVERH